MPPGSFSSDTNGAARPLGNHATGFSLKMRQKRSFSTTVPQGFRACTAQ